MAAKTYDRQTAKFLAVVGENMPEISADVMQGWIENPAAVQKVLKDTFCPPEIMPAEFKVWKTIKLGTDLRSADDFRCALKDGGFRISNWASDILGKPAFTAAAEEAEVELVKVSGAELGFKKGATRRDIYNRAQELGLGLCPNEVGPQLRLQYKDQPMGEWLLVAMEPITDSVGGLRVFGVERGDSGLWLFRHSGYPEDFWCGDFYWLFVRPASNGA